MNHPKIVLGHNNLSYSTYYILFLTYTSYLGGKEGISENKMKFFFLMCLTITLLSVMSTPLCRTCTTDPWQPNLMVWPPHTLVAMRICKTSIPISPAPLIAYHEYPVSLHM